MEQAVIDALAEHLERCARETRDTVKITDAHPDLTLDDAYAIQDVLRARAVARGERLVGYKAGLTSYAKMRQMGVDTPIFGFLTEPMRVADGGEVDTSALIHPKVEPEIVFVLGAALRGPRCDVAAVLAATRAVLPGIEVIDSRYRDFKFDLPSVVADNTSASRFVTGVVPVPAGLFDLGAVGVVMEVNGRVAGTASGAAVLGDPAAAVAMLANHLAARGEEIAADSVILSGGLTEAVLVSPGDHVTVRVQGVGCARFRFR